MGPISVADAFGWMFGMTKEAVLGNGCENAGKAALASAAMRRRLSLACEYGTLLRCFADETL